MANLGLLPLSSFDPRLRSLLEKGCKEYVEIACETPRRAQHLRNVLTTFRSRTKQEYKSQPDRWEPLYGAIISTKKEFPSIVTVRPRLHEFDSVLDKLALKAEEPLGEDPLEAILESLKKNGGTPSP